MNEGAASEGRPPGADAGFARKPRVRRRDESLEVPPRSAFEAELDTIVERVSWVEAAGREDFFDGSPSYDVAWMAIIRLAGLFEVRRFEPFLDVVDPIVVRGIRATRQNAGHGGYRQMDDDEFWHTANTDVPSLVSRLRGAHAA